MDDRLLGYYEQELTYIRELGAEFARMYPKIAGRLLLESDKSEDQHTERLIEAFAFIAGRIHKKIDADFPQVTESLLSIVYPHYVNPIPSTTIVQFTPLKQNIAETGFEIKRDTQLFSKPVNGTPCRFRTCMPVEIWPIEITDAGFFDPVSLKNDAQQAIQIKLQTFNSLSVSAFSWQKLRFFLRGQSHHVYHLYELLQNNVCYVEIEAHRNNKKTEIALSPEDIRPVGFSDDAGLFPFTSRSFPAYRLLFEYFSFPEKFLFFDLNGLGRLRDYELGETISIWFHLNRRAKHNVVVDKDTFSLNTTTAVNLFQRVAEPIRLEHEKTEYHVNPDVRRADSMEVFSVDKVVSVSGTSQAIEKEYKPFYSIRHHLADDKDQNRPAYWHMQRKHSWKRGDSGTEVFLSFVDLDFKQTDPGVEIITVHTTCTNRDIPARLPFGDPFGDFDIETAAPVSHIRCLIKPTPSRRPNMGGNLQWRLISHFALNYLSLVHGGEDALKEILTLYDFNNSPSTRQQINGIVSLQSKHITKKVNLSLCRGINILLTLDESKFVGAGHFLFASILENFFGQYVSVNSFSQLEINTVQHREVLKRWPPRSGTRQLL